MIAGAKKYATDHPTEIELTTLACKTNDDTPCQIAQIQDTVTKGAQAIVISPMGLGVTDALKKAQQAGVKIVFVDNTIPGVVPLRSRRRTTSRAARRRAPTSRPS